MENQGETPNKSKVIITVTDEAMQDMNKIADELGKKGFQVEQVMPMTGVITGSYEQDLSDLSNMDGVLNAEKEGEVKLPPNDSEIQ